MTALLAIEARDYLGGAVVLTVLLALLLVGLKTWLDRLLDRRRRPPAPGSAPEVEKEEAPVAREEVEC